MQGNWENWLHFFGGPRTEKKLRENALKRSSEIQKFSWDNVEISLVVREPRKILREMTKKGVRNSENFPEKIMKM